MKYASRMLPRPFCMTSVSYLFPVQGAGAGGASATDAYESSSGTPTDRYDVLLVEEFAQHAVATLGDGDGPHVPHESGDAFQLAGGGLFAAERDTETTLRGWRREESLVRLLAPYRDTMVVPGTEMNEDSAAFVPPPVPGPWSCPTLLAAIHAAAPGYAPPLLE